MNVKTIRTAAKTLNIKGASKMRKAALVAAIRGADLVRCTVVVLRGTAKAMDIAGVSRLRKSELIAAIRGTSCTTLILPDMLDPIPLETMPSAARDVPAVEDYCHRLVNVPTSERLSRVEEIAGITGTAFISRVITGLIGNPVTCHMAGRDRHLALVAQVLDPEGRRLTEGERAAMRGFRRNVLRALKRGEFSDRVVVAILEALDGMGYGTVHIDELTEMLAKVNATSATL